MRFIFEQILTGGDRNFGYLIGDREAKVAALVDPSYRPELLVERAKAQGLSVEWIINTHGHGDHTNGNNQAQEMTGAKIAIYEGSPVSHDVGLKDNDILNVGSIELRILYTPGHCDDHIVIFIPEFKIAITGDHLFIGKIGGTGTDAKARLQYDNLHRLLKELPGETTVWSGHDVGCRPSSTLDLETATNPFLLAKDFDAFLEMKAVWSSFKAENGLA